ncbi:MAG: toll/interleukin-1 receptor domain-containing protein [bacterium]|nr:toll/interleukin-1 receptor domain-containing protein [bacterium]
MNWMPLATAIRVAGSPRPSCSPGTGEQSSHPYLPNLVESSFENLPFTLTIIWHPDFKDGEDIANHLYGHFRGDVYRGVTPATGIKVTFRWAAAVPGTTKPAAVAIAPDRCHAVVVLVDTHLHEAASGEWGEYLEDIVTGVEATGGASLVFPVAFTREALSAVPCLRPANFFRWYDWEDRRLERLTAALTHELCCLVTPWVAAVEEGKPLPPSVDEIPGPVTIFISHSKQDGKELAETVRKVIARGRLKSFFDAVDIPAGRRFEEVIASAIKRSALMVVLTDTFASREWCRLEVLTARRHEVPVVVLNAVREGEPRAFPYAGNVPVVMASGLAEDRIEVAIARLLDECLRSLYWRMHQEFFRSLVPDALQLPRVPDLLALATRSPRPETVVHPDPPLGEAETAVLRQLIPELRLETPRSLCLTT